MSDNQMWEKLLDAKFDTILVKLDAIAAKVDSAASEVKVLEERVSKLEMDSAVNRTKLALILGGGGVTAGGLGSLLMELFLKG